MDVKVNLLFGVMAEESGKVSQGQLAATAATWLEDPTQELAALLCQAGVMAARDVDFVTAKVNGALHACQEDVDRALGMAGGARRVEEAFMGAVGLDEDGRVVPGKGQDPLAMTQDSLAQTRDPLAQTRDPLAGTRDPLAQTRDPLAQTRDPLAQTRDPLAEESTLPGAGPPGGVSADGVPAVREQRGRYTAIGEHASGGMGKILIVHDEHLSRDIALKELLPERLRAAGTQPGALTSEMLTIPIVARFLQEARITGQLEHPAIVPVYELGYRDDGTLYYTMKYVRGRTLRDGVQDAGSLSERLNLLTHFLDLCHAVAFAHNRGVIHRDIKPMNVMIGEFGETVVIDWGIAKVIGKQDIHERDIKAVHDALQGGDTASATKTQYGQAVGSPYYMPPEQAQGLIDQVDERSDVYSLGAVLYTILTGQVPYLGLSAQKFLAEVVEHAPKPIREIDENVPPELSAICERAMNRSPDERYQSAKELAEEVQRYLAGGLVRAHTYRFSEHLLRFVKRHKTVLTTAALGIAAVVALGVFSYVQVVAEKERAETNWHRAEEERQRADEALVKEEEARRQADAARETAVSERQRALQELYYANISLSERCIVERRMSQARELLAACPEPFRNWEWGRLDYVCNADLATIEAGGQWVRFVGGGGRVLTASIDGRVTVEALAAGEAGHVLVEAGGYNCAVGADGAGARVITSTDEEMVVWDGVRGERVLAFEEPAKARSNRHRSVSLSADGERAAALNNDDTIRVWNVDEGAECASFPAPRPETLDVALPPDGAHVLLTYADMGAEGMAGVIALWGVDSGAKVAEHVLPAPLMARSAVFSADGRLLAVGTNDGVFLFDAASLELRERFAMAVGNQRAVAFSPNGALVAAGSTTGELGVWSTETGEARLAVRAHSDLVSAVVFAPDNRRCVTVSSDRAARMWDVEAGREARMLVGHSAAIFDAAFDAGGERLATAAYDGTTKLWDVGSPLDLVDVGPAAFCARTGLLMGGVGEDVVVWDCATRREEARFGGEEGHGARVYAVAASEDGRYAASAAREQEAGGYVDVVRIWDLNGKRLLRSLDAVGANVLGMDFSPDSAYLGVRAGNAFGLWQVESGDEAARVPDALGYAFSAEGGYVAVGRSGGEVAVSALASGDEVWRVKVEPRFGLTVAFSPGGELLAAGSDVETDGDYEGRLLFFEQGKAEPLVSLDAHDAHVECVAYGPDGRVFATGGRDRLVKLWDGESYGCVQTFRGHAGPVTALAFSPDGARLATAGGDGTFKLWDCATGREVLTLQDAALGHQGEVTTPGNVAFTPDSLYLVTLTKPSALKPMVLRANRVK